MGSEPMVAQKKPTAALMSPLAKWAPLKEARSAMAITISHTFSEGPKASAITARAGATTMSTRSLKKSAVTEAYSAIRIALRPLPFSISL